MSFDGLYAVEKWWSMLDVAVSDLRNPRPRFRRGLLVVVVPDSFFLAGKGPIRVATGSEVVLEEVDLDLDRDRLGLGL